MHLSQIKSLINSRIYCIAKIKYGDTSITWRHDVNSRNMQEPMRFDVADVIFVLGSVYSDFFWFESEITTDIFASEELD